MPSKLHSILTHDIMRFFMLNYYSAFRAFPELTLDTPGEKTTPDIAICEIEPVDYNHDETKRKTPPLATIEILSPTQVLQTLLDKTNDYFSFGVKSCWVVLPSLKSIYVFSAPHQFEVYSHGDELVDEKLGVKMPIDEIFAA